MEFSCNQDTFSKYLNSVSRVVNSKPGLPILSNVLFETSQGKVNMTATDLEMSINCWIGADVASEGKLTVPAKQLAEFINSIPADKVQVVQENQTLNIRTKNNSAQFNTIASDDFPAVASINEGETPLLRITMEDLLKAVGRVAFSTANDDIKPVMTGIKLEIKDDTIAFVGADGLRLSRQISKLPESASKSVELLVPARAFQELAHIVSEFKSEDSQNLIEMYLIEDRNQILFRYNDIDLISRLIDGQYPPYQNVIPTGYKTKAELSKSDFQNSLKVVNIIARSVLGNKIIVNQDSKANSITLSANQADVGNNESSFEAAIEGEGMEMAFSARFLADFLSNVDAGEIVFESNSPVNAGVFKIKGDDSFLHLIMPMRI